MKKIIPVLVALLAVPSLTFAAEVANFRDLSGLLVGFQSFINNIAVPFIFTIAFIVFLYGIFKTFILGASEEEKQKEGKTLMLYSLIGFVLMTSIWGIVNIFISGVGLTGGEGPTRLPTTGVIGTPTN